MEIIPAILEKKQEEIEKKIQLIEPYFKKVQIDFGDGKFVSEKFGKIENFKKIKTDIQLEAHLMIEEPWKVVDQLKKLGFSKITFHYEAFYGVKKKTRGFAINNLIKGIRGIKGTQGINEGVEVGIAINPETSPSQIVDYLPRIDEVLLLAVNPGKQGQTFQADVLTKVNFLKNFRSDLKIGIDGGVNEKNIKSIIDVGTDRVYLWSYLWKQPLNESVRILNESIQTKISKS